MNFDFLDPVEDKEIAHLSLYQEQVFGNKIAIHSKKNGFPDMDSIDIAIVGVQEGRNAIDNIETGKDINRIRRNLYKLFPGNWTKKVADLGNLPQGNLVEDTYFALQEIIFQLNKNKIVAIIIGGGQDLTYANYRAYDKLEQSVNLVTVDNKFDLGSLDEDVTSISYLSKIIMEEPNNLFNFSNIGYQTFFNSQEEIDLLEKLFFDAHRLGEVTKEIELTETIMRDADIVSIDLGAIRSSEASANNNATPNGFYGDEICAIARYAGISDKVSSFGIYEYNAKFENNNQTAQLVAQMIWYFIEGVNFRANDYPFGSKENYQKFIVPLEKDTLNFYKSNKSGRWWIEINIKKNNKFKRHTLIPCTYTDYLDATNQIIPDKWYRAFKKLN